MKKKIFHKNHSKIANTFLQEQTSETRIQDTRTPTPHPRFMPMLQNSTHNYNYNSTQLHSLHHSGIPRFHIISHTWSYLVICGHMWPYVVIHTKKNAPLTSSISSTIESWNPGTLCRQISSARQPRLDSKLAYLPSISTNISQLNDSKFFLHHPTSAN